MAHHRDDDRVPVPLGGPDEAAERLGRPAVLDAEHPGVLAEELVVVGHLVVLALGRGEVGELGADVLAEVGVRQPGPRDQRQVVRRAALARLVQAVRRLGHGVEGLEPLGLGVHVGEGARDSAVGLGERHGGVVARDHHQRAEQVVDLVDLVLGQAHGASLDVARLGAGLDDFVLVQAGDERDGCEDLERAGGKVAAVRVLGGEHLAGVRVGDHEGGGFGLGQRLGRRVDHDAAPSQQHSADGRGVVGRGARLSRGDQRESPGERECAECCYVLHPHREVSVALSLFRWGKTRQRS